MATKSEMSKYKEELCSRYWAYQQEFYPQVKDTFERPFAPGNRAPVFLKTKAENNLLFQPSASALEIQNLVNIYPPRARHRWFTSMNSSQALAQSILGNLKIHHKLDCLKNIKDSFGNFVFSPATISSVLFQMEYTINYLGEPRPTSLDGFIPGDYKIAIECKFTEADFGHCSRPSLKEKDSTYETEYCNRSYTCQNGRKSRCSLTEIGVKYWQYIPDIFTWKTDKDLSLCPLFHNYQIVRNVLAACVKPDGKVSLKNGHSVIIYDERNPAFKDKGLCITAYNETQNALKNHEILKKCSWQQITDIMRVNKILPWLTRQLEDKYGL